MIEVDGLTTQQRLALGGLIEGIQTADECSASLARRGFALAVGTGCIAAIAVACHSVGSQVDGAAWTGRAACLLAMIALAAVSWFGALEAWMPRPIKVATTGDTDVLWERIISLEVEDAFNQVLLDHASLFESASRENAFLARRVRDLARLASAQVVLACLLGVLMVWC